MENMNTAALGMLGAMAMPQLSEPEKAQLLLDLRQRVASLEDAIHALLDHQHGHSGEPLFKFRRRGLIGGPL